MAAATTNSAQFLSRWRSSSSSSRCSLTPHLSFVSFKKAHLGFESKISSKGLECWKGRSRGKTEHWGVRCCTAEGINGEMFVGRRGSREDGVVSNYHIPERFKVVCLVACVMCLCNADRVVMSVAVVPLAAKHAWSTSFLGIVQVPK